MTTTTNPMTRVSLIPEMFDVEIASAPGRTTARVFVRGLGIDREEVYAISTGSGKNAKSLAERFARLIYSGRAIRQGWILTDMYGKTYLSIDWVGGMLIGRRMNADLKKFGF